MLTVWGKALEFSVALGVLDFNATSEHERDFFIDNLLMRIH
jgi:hypothetical protein